MKEKELLQKAAQTVLDEPVRLKINVEPRNKMQAFLQKCGFVPKIREFEIKGAKAGTMIRISEMLLSIGYKPIPENGYLDWNYDLMANHTDTLINIIASAIHNKEGNPGKSLLSLIKWQFTAKELHKVALIVIEQLNIRDFMITMTSIRSLNILKEISPSEPEEIIAPGELSEAQ